MKGEDLIEGGYYIVEKDFLAYRETSSNTVLLLKDTVLKCVTRRKAPGDYSYFLVEGFHIDKSMKTSKYKDTIVKTSDHTRISPYAHKDISSIDLRKHKIQTIKTQIADCKAQIDANNQTISKLETKNKELENKMSNMKIKLSKLERFKSDEEEQAFAIKNFLKKVPGASVEQIAEFLQKLKKD